MPFALIIVGLMLTVVAARDNQDAFFAQLGKDFTGQNSFTNWAVAVLGVGSLGYYKPIKPLIDPFIILMIIAFFISNAGGFENLLPAIQKAFQNAQDQLSGGSVSGSAPTSGATALSQSENSLTSELGKIGQAYSGDTSDPTDTIYPPGFNPLTYQVQ